MKIIVFLKNIVFLLMLATIFAGCNKKTNNEADENATKEKFCTFLNEENMDKTIPFVDEFLSRLAAGLDDEQQLQVLVAWLKSQPCIVDAVLILYGNETPPMSEIELSFDENEMTKRFIMTVSMEKPLKIAGYREYETISLESTKWKLAGYFDVVSNTFQESELNDCDMCHNLVFDEEFNTFFVAGERANNSYITCYLGNYTVNYSLSTIRLEIDKPDVVNDNNEIYFGCLSEVQTFELKADELKLYYNDKNKYILLNQINCTRPMWSVRLILKPQADENYLAIEDPEILVLVSNHKVTLRQSAPGAKNPELLLYYDLIGTECNKEFTIKDFLATGKFENGVYEYSIAYPGNSKQNL